MPMNWGPEADAKLFAAVLKVHDIKVNYAALAAEMGSDCTAKAITHRIAKIKSDGKASSTGAASTPTTPKRARATKTVSTPKTPLTAGRERSRRASVKATNYAQSDDDDSEDGVKRDADAGEGEESPSKKMKREVVEEGEFEGEDGV
ncbi:hypothetical protein EG328_011494 [Venturia inaequalis]|uniref:Uncharacterized protein n=1 Tax=Venturia inaequalis TaxID=5025 RepID=A0A8H3UFY0_VENIN|nr:hypothetical protein EG328_011494 [Venturia inaequalis]KAE9969871.1 hypothetical protein EG327_010440 [Venturia inaequalis]RDI82654.1 hypothetical protein Vi05172_g7444 [Venturia inaequalis]